MKYRLVRVGQSAIDVEGVQTLCELTSPGGVRFRGSGVGCRSASKVWKRVRPLRVCAESVERSLAWRRRECVNGTPSVVGWPRVVSGDGAIGEGSWETAGLLTLNNSAGLIVQGRRGIRRMVMWREGKEQRGWETSAFGVSAKLRAAVDLAE